ncbi:protein disulfide isomerase isoform X1 [Augochlora pura]
MDQTLNLLALNKFLHETLAFTEEVKDVIKSDCGEATFSLKAWCKKTVTKQENSGNFCTCIKSETEVEEIATDISRTLLQTQQLREKLSSNVKKGKKYLKQPSVTEIYNPYVSGNGKRKENTTLGMTSDKTKKDTKLLAVKSSTIENKNFLTINKRNIKNITEVRKHRNHKLEKTSKSNCLMAKSEYVEFDKRSSAASTTELKSLIEKISHPSNSSHNVNDGNCPIHNDLTPEVTYDQNIITMDVVDSIKAFNIPGEIIKPLKAYHTYLNSEYSDKSFNNKKRQKICNIFLMEFNKMDDTIQNELVSKSDNVTLLRKFISHFSNFFLKNKEKSTLDNMEKIYVELNLIWKQYDKKNFNNLEIWKSHMQETLLHNHSTVGSMSHGMWTLEYNLKYFNGMNVHSLFLIIFILFYFIFVLGVSKLQYIPYTNKNQLLSFFEMLQQLQQVKYFKDLVNIIIKEVLPNVTMTFDFTKPECIKLYKMLYILHQGLNPKIPVLVRTDG